MHDLSNYVDPETIEDKYEKVKYLFPFYRMDIDSFEKCLKGITNEHEYKSSSFHTSYISIEDMKIVLSLTPAWK